MDPSENEVLGDWGCNPQQAFGDRYVTMHCLPKYIMDSKNEAVTKVASRALGAPNANFASSDPIYIRVHYLLGSAPQTPRTPA